MIRRHPAVTDVTRALAESTEGHRRLARGADVVGFVECHGRLLTEELIGGLEVIPRKEVDYRGQLTPGVLASCR